MSYKFRSQPSLSQTVKENVFFGGEEEGQEDSIGVLYCREENEDLMGRGPLCHRQYWWTASGKKEKMYELPLSPSRQYQ